MAPELVQASNEGVAHLTDQAARLGTPRIVKIIETIGLAINDMRNALDARVILEVALVRLVHQELDMGLESVVARVARLEKELENRPVLAPAPVDPSTGRAVLGGRVSPDSSGSLARPAAPVAKAPKAAPAKVVVEEPTIAVPEATADVSVSGSPSPQRVVDQWTPGVLDALRGMHKAVLKMAEPSVRDDTVVLLVDNEPSAVRVRKYTDEFTPLIHRVAGGVCPIVIEVRQETSQPVAKKSTPVVDDEGDQYVDLEEIKTLPTVTNTTIADQLTDLFPGSELIPEGE
jgi:DNA polymerase III gamma/tau subunit